MIGVFDSGLGGLTVLKEFRRTCPDYNYIYLGDNARVPYGSKSQDLIYQYTTEAVDFLFKQDCHLVVLACNSASSMALRRLQQEWLPKHYPDRRVLGVIRPIAENIVERDFKRIGVIGTKATIESNVYVKEIRKLEIEKLSNCLKIINYKLKIVQRATPLLVPLAEEAYNDDMVIDRILENYLAPLREAKVEYLVLGCTHYSLLMDNIKRVMGVGCVVENPASIVALRLRDYINRHPELLETSGPTTGDPVVGPLVYTTDDAYKFKENGERVLGERIDKVEKVNIQK